MPSFFRIGTKDDTWVYFQGRHREEDPPLFEVEWTPDEAEEIGKGLVERAQLIRNRNA